MAGTADAMIPSVTPLTAHEPRTAGPYRLLGRLGQGGQGVVYLGVDAQDRRVAIKMLTIDLRHNPKARARFGKEIAAARQVAPFCTAQILFAELDAELPYVVSEFIEGPTLYRQVREHGPITDNALYRLAVGTATALAAIHQAGIVHCDLKPDNVILGLDGPRVIDFGIARALGSETVTSHVMGTVPYMAPERFHNVDVGPRCDVFAWAATIGFASAGRAPFGQDSMATVMARVLNEPPELHNLSGTLLDLVTECLAKDQHARPTAEQMLMRLLGHAATPAASMPLVEALQEGSDAATTLLPPDGAMVPGRNGATGSTSNVPTKPKATAAFEPTAEQPTTFEPAAEQPTTFEPAAEQPTGFESITPLTMVQQPTADQPITPLTMVQPVEPQATTAVAPAQPRPSWSRRLARQAGEPIGISAAIVLGAVGFGAGFVASADTGTAAVLAAATFVVVYVARLLVATALDEGNDE